MNTLKKNRHIISIIMLLVLIIGSIGSFAIASVKTPDISMKYLGISPQNPKTGEEITATYEIDPKPFKMREGKKEIILVLDASNSMKKEVTTSDGTKSTRVAEMKKATKSLIEKLKDIKNLKIGIATFGGGGKIEINNGTYMLPVSNPNLLKYIDDITLTGGTNTGEGLRKGEYILRNGHKDANKSIVFISDGLPRTRSVDANNNFYLDIDNTNPKVIKKDQQKGLEYAKAIGNIVGESSPNIFTVGYGLENEKANKMLKEVHESMHGVDDNFFATDSEIDKIVDKIGDQLEKSYKVKNANINYEISEEVTSVQILNQKPHIEYKLEDDGWYRAEKVILEFKFICNRPGDINVLKNIKLTYDDLDGKNIEVDVEDLNVTIAEASAPKIDFNYVGMMPEKPKVGEEVEVTYEIDPHPFEIDISNREQEIVLVLDKSGSMQDVIVGTNETKMDRLKKAAKLFIEDLRNIKNIKVGIVSYINNATIDTTSGMLSPDDSELIKIIDEMRSGGATNTGDGIRKAEYLLRNGSQNADKSIILMSDGLPSNYSIHSNGEYYLDIDDKDVQDEFSWDKAPEYAKAIGNIVSESKHDIYTIGYGLGEETSKENKTLKDIHISMGGTDSHFYATDDKIEEIFDEIAGNLKDKYNVEESQINLELGQDITVISEINNTPKISYKLQEDGWYRAEKQLFKFKFKPNKSGEIEVVKNIQLQYKDLDGNNVSVPAQDLTINIERRKVPDIDLNYIGIEPKNPVVGDEVTITYELDPQPFKMDAPPPQEIVLVLDDSGSMKQNNKIYNLKKAAKKFITQLKGTENLKVGIVSYSTLATINPTSTGRSQTVETVKHSGYISRHSVAAYNSNSNPTMYDINDPILGRIIDSLQAVGGTNTGEGLRKAEYILANSNPEANKSIVLMSDGLPTFKSVIDIRKNKNEYMNIDNSTPGVMGDGNENSQYNIDQSENYAKKIGNIISEKGYNIFTIGYGLGNSSSQRNKTLQEIHKSMGGSIEQFYATDSNIEQIFDGIANKLENSYRVDNPKIDFTFSQDIQITDLFDETPEINYKLEDDGWYRASKIPIIFKFKTIKPGIIEVVKNPELTYNDIDGEFMTSQSDGVTIEVKDKNLMISHGLLTKSNDNITIGVNNTEVIKDMYYNIGIDMEIREENAVLNINPSNDSSIDNSLIKIYKHDGNGNIISEVKNASIDINNKNISILNLDKGKYIVSYYAKFNNSTGILANLERDNIEFIGNIKIDENVEIDLPELF